MPVLVMPLTIVSVPPFAVICAALEAVTAPVTVPAPVSVPAESVMPAASVRGAPEDILIVPLSVRTPATVSVPAVTFSCPELETPPPLSDSALVPLLLMGYSLVTQLMPAVLLSLWEQPRASAAGAFAGILAGELVVAYLSISSASISTLVPSAPQVIKDLNVGVVALAVNVVVLGAVSLVSRPPMRSM